jgi:hypothetical protein
MKSKHKLFWLGSIITIISLVVFSCSDDLQWVDEHEIEKSNLATATMADKVAYTEKHLKTLAKSALSLSKDSEFRQMVYDEIDKQFDGDFNVLFETLSATPGSDNSIYGIKMAKTFNSPHIFSTALHAFKDIEETNYFPQIYIPFYEELKERKSSANSRLLSVESDPVIIFLIGGDSKDDVFTGYKMDESGELIEAGIMVDEAYAMENEVWVISLNERYFENSIEKVSRNNREEFDWNLAYILGMAVKCHHESWAAGASEVHTISVFSDFQFSNPYVQLYGGGPNEGGHIADWTRKQVQNQTWKEVQFHLNIHPLSIYTDRPYCSYVIFEYDTWPTGTRELTWSRSQTGQTYQYTWSYRSADPFYDAHYYTVNQSYQVDNNCIKWIKN